MLKIGEFAVLTGISINMLRNYDKINLLVPEYTDETNNYRYYTESQIIIANRIQILKELGFGLKEISKIIKCSNDEIKDMIFQKINEKQEEKRLIDSQIKRMNKAIDNLDMYSDFVFDIKLKPLEARKVISIRANINNFEEEGLLWQQMEQRCIENDIKEANSEYTFAITYSVDFENSKVDTEVQKTVSKKPKNIKGLNYYETAEIMAAVVSCKGEYSRVSEINNYVKRYINDTKYELAGAPLRKYYISPNSKCSPEEFITQYYYPLKVK